MAKHLNFNMERCLYVCIYSFQSKIAFEKARENMIHTETFADRINSAEVQQIKDLV